MNTDFENRLQNLPLREPPHAWRSELFTDAQPASVPCPISRLSAWLWPHPRAWAGLGAAWLVILGLNLAAGKNPAQTDNAPAHFSSQALRDLRQQQRILARIIAPSPILDAEPPEPADPRRSENSRILIMV